MIQKIKNGSPPTARRQPLDDRPQTSSNDGSLIRKQPCNDTLPFDVLCQIFEHHGATETDSHPLEILLFVCKFWLRTAYHHEGLWTKFNISTRALSFWCSRVPLRLSRCSSSSLLDINISTTETDRTNTAKELDDATKILYSRLIGSLTGARGEIARRWRKVSVIDRGVPHEVSEVNWKVIGTSNWAALFSFPTPNLEELYMWGVFSASPILPATPSLKIFRADLCDLPSLPDMGGIVEVSLSSDCLDASTFSLMNAAYVTKLEITEGRASYCLFGNLPRLKSLLLSPGLVPSEDSDQFSTPELMRLHLCFEYALDFQDLLSCDGIPLHRLQELVLELSINRWQDHFVYMSTICQFLRAIPNVDVLVFANQFSAVLISNLLVGDCESLYQVHSPLVRYDGREARLGQGTERWATAKMLLGSDDWFLVEESMVRRSPLELLRNDVF